MKKTYAVPEIYQTLQSRKAAAVMQSPIQVSVPGSKSITNRALLLATLANGKSTLRGVLFSDDSRHFLKCIQDLGFKTTVDEDAKVIAVEGHGGTVPKSEADQFVGSAGTAARFLTAYLGISNGVYHMDASEQMRKRPMAPLLNSLRELGCEVIHENSDGISGEGHFPFTLKSHGFQKSSISVNIDSSSQFLSALLIASCLSEKDFTAYIEGTHGRSYIDMTVKMMAQFGVQAVPLYYCTGGLTHNAPVNGGSADAHNSDGSGGSADAHNSDGNGSSSGAHNSDGNGSSAGAHNSDGNGISAGAHNSNGNGGSSGAHNSNGNGGSSGAHNSDGNGGKAARCAGCINSTLPMGYRTAAGQSYHALDYQVEPDVSAACYFYAMSPLLGIPVQVAHVHFDSLQGDVAFIRILEKMGCRVTDPEGGIIVEPPADGVFHGITADMSACSDQAITLAAIAPYADCPTTITGIGHIRFQESDRITAIVTELRKMGIRCEDTENSITICPGQPKAALIETYDDHRMAMGFSLTGLRSAGIVIDNPGCCKKTFEEYFDVLDWAVRALRTDVL